MIVFGNKIKILLMPIFVIIKYIGGVLLNQEKNLLSNGKYTTSVVTTIKLVTKSVKTATQLTVMVAQPTAPPKT